MVRVPRLRPDTGLCEFEHVDRWFKANKTAVRESARICTNCPVIAACAQKALRLGVTHGVWAGVDMPGTRSAADLEAARRQLREVIAHPRPAELQLRALQIRRAIHFAATERAQPAIRRRRPATPHTAAATGKRSA